MFLWNFSEIVKKIWRNVGNISYKFFKILMEILWLFVSIFRKTYEKLLEKYEKYLTVSASFKNAVITLCDMTTLNIFLLQISYCFCSYRNAKSRE